MQLIAKWKVQLQLIACWSSEIVINWKLRDAITINSETIEINCNDSACITDCFPLLFLFIIIKTSMLILRYWQRVFAWSQQKYITLRIWFWFPPRAFTGIILSLVLRTSCVSAALPPRPKRECLPKRKKYLRTPWEYTPEKETPEDHPDQIILSVM